MAEAEDVITDVARHATRYAQTLWARHQAGNGSTQAIGLQHLSSRLELLIASVAGTAVQLRVALPAARRTFLTRCFLRPALPWQPLGIPATDGNSIWLPRELPSQLTDTQETYKAIALAQAIRVRRGSADLPISLSERGRDIYLLLEAHGADVDLCREMPGATKLVQQLRRHAAAVRPAARSLHGAHAAMERLACDVLATAPHPNGPFYCRTPDQSAALALQLLTGFPVTHEAKQPSALFKDLWTGELRAPSNLGTQRLTALEPDTPDHAAPRAARMGRRPAVREASDDENDAQPGAWMVQTAQPQEHAEDPVGMQRPTDRDEDTAAEEFADSLSELEQARLVTTPGRPKEYFLSDDPFDQRGSIAMEAATKQQDRYAYPEWDFRVSSYRHPGALVQETTAEEGNQHWVDQTLSEQAALLYEIKRQFQLLRAQRSRLRRLTDGDDIDIDAYTASFADFRAGLSLNDAVYQTSRPGQRDMAILLLVDVSGSTDSWMSGHRRIIDIEREAVLLVALALDALGEAFEIAAFSGEGPQGVRIKILKHFDEPYRDEVARRVAGLEPEQYTRAGAAMRHATQRLMRRPAHHRLLLLLSDGKPNDIDAYEGRYGVEDFRQAVIEAQQQSVHAFCMTVDRQAGKYMPHVFGHNKYFLLQHPERLPGALLQWLRQLVSN